MLPCDMFFSYSVQLKMTMDISAEMDREIIHDSLGSAEEEDNSVYSSAIVPDVMWKIRDDCEKLMVAYNESTTGGEWFQLNNNNNKDKWISI